MLEGKTLIVTGVGTGLGSEIMRAAHRDGANLVLAARTEATLEAAAAEVAPNGDRVAIVPTDITDEAQCVALAKAAVDRFGGLDALAQVAAIDAHFDSLADFNAEDVRRVMDTNFTGSLQMARAVVAPMKAQGGGSIVLIGSQSSFMPQVSQLSYSSSKGALRTAMMFLAKELGPDRIRVNTVVPTWMWGPAVEGYVNGEAERRGVAVDEVIQEITANMCIPEIPKDDDVAEAVVFLASDRARMITGQHLMVNSGELMI
ncbi:SDR family oxidoreductase [Myxococcota bacterium]|nr:SDR family oxidoreductase [Myxococcota bacterium]